MSGYVLFQMWGPFRQSLIQGHLFYVEQARKRLLSQFEDIEADADRAAEEWLEQSGQHFDPDRHDPGDFYEAANDAGIEFYGLLSDMREQTRLSVVAGMFHQWDKQLRDWLAREIQHWHRGDNATLKIWSAGGAMMPIQAAMNARLANGVGGMTWATAISALGVAVVLAFVGFVAGFGRSTAASWQVPWWAWGGGFCGALVLFSAAAATFRIGTMPMVASMVAGQVFVSIVLDANGWLGVTLRPPTVARMIAALLILAGATILAFSAGSSRAH